MGHMVDYQFRLVLIVALISLLPLFWGFSNKVNRSDFHTENKVVFSGLALVPQPINLSV